MLAKDATVSTTIPTAERDAGMGKAALQADRSWSSRINRDGEANADSGHLAAAEGRVPEDRYVH